VHMELTDLVKKHIFEESICKGGTCKNMNLKRYRMQSQLLNKFKKKH